MFRAKLIVLIAVTMAFAQFHCAVACAGNGCNLEVARCHSVPPCHRHHDHSHDRTAASCGFELTKPPATSLQVLQMRATVTVSLGTLANLASVVARDAYPNRLALPVAFSPPESPHNTPSVLRI